MNTIKELKRFYGVFISRWDNENKNTPFIAICYATRINETCLYKTNKFDNGNMFLPEHVKLFRTEKEACVYFKQLVDNMLHKKQLQFSQLQDEINALKHITFTFGDR